LHRRDTEHFGENLRCRIRRGVVDQDDLVGNPVGVSKNRAKASVGQRPLVEDRDEHGNPGSFFLGKAKDIQQRGIGCFIGRFLGGL
jgi:hypothetical protein